MQFKNKLNKWHFELTSAGVSSNDRLSGNEMFTTAAANEAFGWKMYDYEKKNLQCEN